ncbi:MAG: DUF5686 family protein [Tannerellaceae bacterium]|jgi:hypothetical protein|nr:DUF5686 family protein [Tannerellaceae bacterium]
MRYSIWLVILCLLSLRLEAGEAYGRAEKLLAEPEDEAVALADSVMNLVIASAAQYSKLLMSSEAEVYIKGRTKILEKNTLIRFAHHLFPVNQRVPDMLFEMVSLSKFEAPNAFFHDFKAINGSSIPNRKKRQEILSFLNLNIYASTAFNDAVLMPTAKNAFRHYDFRLMDVENSDFGAKVYRIRFLPKNLSQKLITGYLYVIDKTWTIARIELSGRYYFSDFILTMTFGREPNRFNLPETADLSLTYRMLGNTVSSAYHSKYNYTSVVWAWDDVNKRTRDYSSLNLSRYYGHSSDSVPIILDSLYWRRMRDQPLVDEENALYARATDQRLQPVDTLASLREQNPYLSFTELITNPINRDYKNTYIRYYGILNPSQLGYSKNNGISLRQRMRIQKRYENETRLSFVPELGFVSKRKEFFFKAEGLWEYWPERLGSLRLLIGNGNQSYSFGMMEEINKQLADSSFKAEDLNLQYFRHYYVDLTNRIDLANGFQLTTGLTYNRRNPIERTFGIEVGDKIKEIINSDYHDFTSTLGFTYTPRYYYRMDGRRKDYVFSYYPSISLEFAQASPGVWRSKGDYSRIEADVQQSLSLGLLQKLNYHFSAGMYISKRSSYFTDFRYFTHRNFPDTWDDQIGGVFNLLGREWFYASNQYVQAHFMYQSPFILLQFFEKEASKYVFAERIYFSQLWTPALPSYTEIGYGIGNHLFNIALFAGFDRLKYQGVGFKFAFELF